MKRKEKFQQIFENIEKEEGKIIISSGYGATVILRRWFPNGEFVIEHNNLLDEPHNREMDSYYINGLPFYSYNFNILNQDRKRTGRFTVLSLNEDEK